jgi:hypothetical protein
MHTEQAITSIKQKGLTEACKKLVEKKDGVRENHTKGHGSVSHDHSVYCPQEF